ncbi:MAG: SDR family oxidoreductase [Hyphomicrobiaceae bacterium]
MKYGSVFRPGLFADHHFVITGGGSGIGRCTAHELASLGAHVALVGRDPDRLIAVAAEIESTGAIAPTTHVCDIRDEEASKRTIAAILIQHGQIDGLVNNAGGQFPSPLRDITRKGWDAVIANNLTGGFLMARECFTQWMEANGGSIVNMIADMWWSMPGMGHSGAARAGMLNFTMTAAVEWAAAGVRVNAVAPGAIASSGLDTYSEPMKARLQEYWRHIPAKRLGTEAECSAAIVFLLSPAAAFISGSCLRIDGAQPNGKSIWPMPDHKKSRPFRGFPLERAPAYLEPREPKE